LLIVASFLAGLEMDALFAPDGPDGTSRHASLLFSGGAGGGGKEKTRFGVAVAGFGCVSPALFERL